jgi:uncharacterized lipoprotein YmbA
MRALRPLLVAGLVGLTGCFSLSRTEPLQQHYVLGGGHLQQNDTPAGNPAGLTVGVRRLRLATYLEPAFLVVRQGPNRITYAEFHRWGEPLGGGISRAVAGYLVARSPIRAVDVAPWPLREQYDYLIQLHVERFEGVVSADPNAAEGEVHLLATWEIIRQQDGAVLARGTTDHRASGWRVGDHAGLVNQLDAGLNVLAHELASSLASLGAARAEGR